MEPTAPETPETAETALVVVSTTVDSREVAETLAHSAIAERVAACAQIVGQIDSVYRWRGAVESAQEWLVLFKTTAARYDALERHLRSAHPYDVPEIIATPVSAAHVAYRDWVREQTAPT